MNTTTQESHNWDSSLHLPLWVPDTEKSRSESNLEKWVNQLETSGADIATISSLIKNLYDHFGFHKKPRSPRLRFMGLHSNASACSDIYRQKTSSEFSWNYIAGAGDDEESWARGLKPNLFWNNVYDLISSGPDLCNQKVADIVIVLNGDKMLLKFPLNLQI